MGQDIVIGVRAMTVKTRLHRADFALSRRRDAERRVQRRQHGATVTQAEVRRHHDAGDSLDHALYSCQCGYIFEAPVSTSVGCPHCGSVQAW